MIIELPGVPIAKQRHRSFIAANRVIAFDKQRDLTKATREIMRECLQRNLDHEDKSICLPASAVVYGHHFSLEMDFYVPYPKSLGVFQSRVLRWRLSPPASKPDLDNYIKFYLDCANGVLFADDSQVYALTARKFYSDNPRTVIKMLAKKQMSLHEEAEQILSLVEPTDFQQIVERSHELAEFISGFSKDGKHALMEENPERYRRSVAKAAAFLSWLQDVYGPVMTAVRKRAPQYHERYLSMEKGLNDLDKGTIDEV